MRTPRTVQVLATATVMTLVVFAGAGPASARAARYCDAVRMSHALPQLSGVVAGLSGGSASRADHLVLVRSARALRNARGHAPRSLRGAFAAGYRPLLLIDRARTMSSAQAGRLRSAFTRLDRAVGSRCHLPELLSLPDDPKSAGLARLVGRHAAGTPSLGAAAMLNRGPFAHATGVDPGLCASKSDGRASILANFVVDVCWDGSALHLMNRTTLVQRVSGSGVSASARKDFPPQEWASWIVAQSTDDWVLPPNYGLTLRIDSSAASISVSPAETKLLETYGLTKVLVGYLPFDPLMENAVAGLVHGLDDAVAKARQCLNHANVFKKVACSVAFFASATWVFGSFVADASVSSVKKDAVKGTLKHAAEVLWGLIQEGKYVADVFGDVIAPGTTHLTIAAASSPPTQQPPVVQPPTQQPPTTTQPPMQQPPVVQPPAPQTWSEQETPNHAVNTFTNPHNASGMGPAIAAGQWVQVACKVYDPTIQSVNPDGYWYRIATPPWNNAYYSPANTFMNGDPVGGPYTHNTDFAVANC